MRGLPSAPGAMMPLYDMWMAAPSSVLMTIRTSSCAVPSARMVSQSAPKSSIVPLSFGPFTVPPVTRTMTRVPFGPLGITMGGFSVALM